MSKRKRGFLVVISLEIGKAVGSVFIPFSISKVLAHKSNDGSLLWTQITQIETLGSEELDDELLGFVEEVISYSIHESVHQNVSFFLVNNAVFGWEFEWDLSKENMKEVIHCQFNLSHDGCNSEDEKLVIERFEIPFKEPKNRTEKLAKVS